jgi:hypothetical protein
MDEMPWLTPMMAKLFNEYFSRHPAKNPGTKITQNRQQIPNNTVADVHCENIRKEAVTWWSAVLLEREVSLFLKWSIHSGPVMKQPTLLKMARVAKPKDRLRLCAIAQLLSAISGV